MTHTQKETLRDCFEGCFNFDTAWQMAGIDTKEAYVAAWRTWNKWRRQMDERGYYTF
jgi:hypothetical protein